MAWTQNDTILALVAFAWAGFGASFGPTVILALFWRKLSAMGALAGMVTGAVIVGIWGNISGGIFDLYEILPGFLGSLLAAWAVSLITYQENADVQREFTETVEAVR